MKSRLVSAVLCGILMIGLASTALAGSTNTITNSVGQVIVVITDVYGTRISSITSSNTPAAGSGPAYIDLPGGYRIAYGSATNGAGSVTFNRAFLGTPISVNVFWQDDAIDGATLVASNVAISVSSVTSNGFSFATKVGTLAATNIRYTALGYQW